MSAIAGIIHFNSEPARLELIEKITGTMTRRGSDGSSHWVGGAVALGHGMLHTTLESLGETQPLVSEDGSLVLVMDGRLDNRDQLFRELQAVELIPKPPTDAELVLGAYRLWGEDSPKHLLGDFAYAIWDMRRQVLFCALDHMGARPFYYVSNQQIFAFASEEEALLGLPGVSSQPNEDQIASILVPVFVSFENQRSWLRDVWGLSPGHSMVVFPNGTRRTETYWQLEPSEEDFYRSDQECEEAFLAVFGEAVRCRLRINGHPAAMMSGGMDSASIAAMVHRLLPEMPGKRFHAYSAIADDPASCVESRCIQSLTGGSETDAHRVSVPSFRGMTSVDDLVEMAWSETHPCDNSILMLMAMCQAASRQGDRVLLHGVCGDLTLDSPMYYAAHLLRAGQWREAWLECQAASRNHTYLQTSSPTKLFLQNAKTAYIPGMVEALKSPLRRLLGRSALRHNVINPRFTRKLRLAERLRRQEAEQRRHLGDTAQQAYIQLLSSLSVGPVLGLAGLERVAGRYGVELRDPWADRRVVEFFLRLPLKHKVRDGWTKRLARTAFLPELDEIVRRRLGKEHLGWQFIVRLMDETDGFVSQVFEQELDSVGEYVDVNAVRKRYAKYQAYKSDLDRRFVYEMVSFILWMRRLSPSK